MNEDLELAQALVAGIAKADALAIAECFGAEARLRALIPPGPVERYGAAAAGELIASWFADSDPLVLIERSVERVADRLHVSYRMEGTEMDGGPHGPTTVVRRGRRPPPSGRQAALLRFQT